MNKCCILSNTFSASVEDDHLVFVLCSSNMVSYIDLGMVSQPPISGIIPLDHVILVICC